MLYWSKELK